MNTNYTITLTFGDVGENHKGMQMLGTMVKKGDGFNLDDLKTIKKNFEDIACKCKIVNLNKYLDKYFDNSDTDDDIDESKFPDDAYILIISEGIQELLNNTSDTYDDLCEEQLGLSYDKKAFMYGRIVNKNARYNLCFDDKEQKPDYENGKGTIVAYKSMPILNNLVKRFPDMFGAKFKNMKCESNYYYDVTKTGIGYHGDSERRKVVAIRLGNRLDIHYQWYHHNKPIGEHIKLELNGGDIYVMSEKAVGTDWKSSSQYTLRHATGCDRFTDVNKN